MTSLDRAYQIVQKPVITEKATDRGAVQNIYTFRVPLDANKVEIRRAVERLFSKPGAPIRVLAVNTLRVTPKARRRGWAAGHTQEWKKAMVRLAEGQTIEVL
jgi:large subunit ribosomal protein L23